MNTHKRYFQKPCSIYCPGVIDREKPSLNLFYPLRHDIFGDINGNTIFQENACLHIHNLIKSCHSPSLWMVRNYQVNRFALARQSVSKENFANLHINTDKNNFYISIRVSI